MREVFQRGAEAAQLFLYKLHFFNENSTSLECERSAF